MHTNVKPTREYTKQKNGPQNLNKKLTHPKAQSNVKPDGAINISICRVS